MAQRKQAQHKTGIVRFEGMTVEEAETASWLEDCLEVASSEASLVKAQVKATILQARIFARIAQSLEHLAKVLDRPYEPEE